jgi:NAD(P)-dependent dehydrogenase (short-subunit alcohol dehydrogenase family)
MSTGGNQQTNACELQGKVAVVTGAGASGPGFGTGKAIAVRFASAGAKLALFDVNPQACAETAALVLEQGGESISVAGDVSCAADVQRLINACLNRFGNLDIVVNNVGIRLGQGLREESEEQWERVVSVNAKGVFLMSKYAVPHLIKIDGGRIINISSVAGIRVTSVPPSYGYAASKAAILQMTRAMALEFASYGLRCNCIIPGMLDTTNLRTAYAAVGLPLEEIEVQIERRNGLSPTGKQGTAWDVADAALFLASSRANFINGAELLVDGGQVQATAM